MWTPPADATSAPQRLRTARVLRVREQACEVWDAGTLVTTPFAPMFPSPREERVSPGHLVATAAGPNHTNVVVWRWYDAVVLSEERDGSVRLWEPAHGEFVARPRTSYLQQTPGERAYVSAGLPGAEWWVADRANGPEPPNVELDEVDALYTGNGLWPTVFGVTP